MRRLLFLLIPALLAVTAVGCSSDEEVVGTTAPASGTHTATASATPTGTATAPATGTPTPTVTAVPSPTPTVPASWPTYSDANLGFSLRYPPYLTVTEKGPRDPAQGERDIEFRTQGDAVLTVILAIIANDRHLALDEWTTEYAACLPDSISRGTVSGHPAIFCTSQPAELPSEATVFAHDGNVYLLKSLAPAQDYPTIVASLVVPAQ